MDDPAVQRGESRGISPRPLAVSVGLAVLLGAVAGIGFFTFGYGEGSSYLRDDPGACANCHVMNDAFASWRHSGHAHVATCNDCHLSHHPIGKWFTKADNGFFHSLAFTFDSFHEPIEIKPRNRRVTQAACVSCHREVVDSMVPGEAHDAAPLCVRCHPDVGHGGRGPGLTERST